MILEIRRGSANDPTTAGDAPGDQAGGGKVATGDRDIGAVVQPGRAFVAEHEFDPQLRVKTAKGRHQRCHLVAREGRHGSDAERAGQNWLRKSEHRDKWSFCLKAASMRAAQEKQ
jgi:hypothetical protein